MFPFLKGLHCGRGMQEEDARPFRWLNPSAIISYPLSPSTSSFLPGALQRMPANSDLRRCR